MAGWIKLHRGWRDCPAFTNSAFSDQEAWLWLLENAAWAPIHRIAGKGNVIAIGRGQIHSSERTLAGLWKWDRKRVKRFLTRLEKCKMCHLIWDHSGALITICNYEEYQSRDTNQGTNQGTDAGPSRDHPGTTQEEGKEGLEGKEGKNVTAPNGAAGDYAFEGRVIRLTWADFNRWHRAYPDIDLQAKLCSRDDWLATEGDEATRKKWFVSTSNYLDNAQQRATAAKREAEADDDRITV